MIKNEVHQGSVNSISWAPWESGLRLASCSSDGSISIFSRKAKDDSWSKIYKEDAH